MNSHVLHKVRFFQPGITSAIPLRKKRRRHCSNCRTYLRRKAIRCGYCGQKSLTRWHLLLLVITILILGALILTVLGLASD
jgi:hypothetical protein